MKFDKAVHVFTQDSIQLLKQMEGYLRELDRMPEDQGAIFAIQSCVGQVKLLAKSCGTSPAVGYAVLIECLYRECIKGEIGLMSLIAACLLRDHETGKRAGHGAEPVSPFVDRESASVRMNSRLPIHDFEMA